MASFRFCLECNNMLYPREDKDSRRLLFQCRNCDYTEIADSPLIYRNEIITDIEQSAGNTQDIGKDPTLPRSNKECPTCGSRDAVFFQPQQRRPETPMVSRDGDLMAGDYW